MKKLTLEQVSTLASKLKVENGNVVFAEDLKLPDYDIDWQEACLFALIVDNFKKGNDFKPELLVGKFGFTSYGSVYCMLAKLDCKNLLIQRHGKFYPADAHIKEIDMVQAYNLSIIKAIDYLLKQEKTLCSENRLINILDFIIDYCSGDFCTGCEDLSEDKKTCLSRGDSIDCRNSLLKRILNGTLNAKGGAK